MAPTVSLADDVDRLSAVVAELARQSIARQGQADLGRAASAAGLAVGSVRAFLDGSVSLPPRQSIVLVAAFLELSRARRASYAAQVRQGHAGSDVGGHESTVEAVQAALGELRAEFPSWRCEVDGAERLGTDRPGRVVWSARHVDGDWPQVSAGTSHELRHKLSLVEESMRATAAANGSRRPAGARGGL